MKMFHVLCRRKRQTDDEEDYIRIAETSVVNQVGMINISFKRSPIWSLCSETLSSVEN